MWRTALAVALCGCTPPADTVGAWTTGATSTTLPGASTSGEMPESSSSAADDSTPTSSTSTTTSASTGGESSTSGAAAPPPWVATIADGASVQLRVVELDGGMVVDVCELAGVVEPDALAFLPDDRLVGTHAGTAALWIADPCDCAVTMVPPLEPPLALHAMAERDDVESTLVGVDALRQGLFEVPLAAATVIPVAELADAAAILAIAAAPGTGDLHVIADGLRLQRMDVTGAITSDVPLAIPDDATGLTIDPQGDALLACDGAGTLWRIDPSDGSSEALAFALPDACRTLATPHGTVACIDAVFAE
jgi:hypothetical protein